MPPKGKNKAMQREKGKGQIRPDGNPAQPNIMSFFAAAEPTLKASPTATATHDEKPLEKSTPPRSIPVIDLTHNSTANASTNTSSTRCGATTSNNSNVKDMLSRGFAKRALGSQKHPKETAATSRAVALDGGRSATGSNAREGYRRASELVKQALRAPEMSMPRAGARDGFRRASELVKQPPTAPEVSMPRAGGRSSNDLAGGMPEKWRGRGFVRASELSNKHDQAPSMPAASISRTRRTAANTSATTSSSPPPAHKVHGLVLASSSSKHESVGDRVPSARGAITINTETSKSIDNISINSSSTRSTTGAGAIDTSNKFSSWGSLGVNRAYGGASPRGTNQRRPPRDNRPVHLPFHVVGLQFREARVDSPSTPTAAPQQLEPDTALQLEREPCNSHDPNAIKVLLPPSLGATFLGYVPGRVAVLLAPFLDAMPGAAVARASARTVGDGEEEEGGEGRGVVIGDGGRQTLPAVLELQPLDGVDAEPFGGLMLKVRLFCTGGVLWRRGEEE